VRLIFHKPIFWRFHKFLLDFSKSKPVKDLQHKKFFRATIELLTQCFKDEKRPLREILRGLLINLT
ncbi:hypothetical protein, partial [Lactobacillus helveticus]|uniref:hypothetical protein n=1 Tax=Lactobacillus helveticus TaxID=1587 RepID=UPI001C266132